MSIDRPDEIGGGAIARTSVERVRAALAAGPHPELAERVVEMPATTRSAADAARAIGCAQAQIAKSLVFRGAASGEPYLVIASGAHRVDESRLGRLAAEPIGKANAAFVRERTGFAIGGVPPIGHASPMRRVLVDRALLAFDVVWAAAGSPFAVFPVAPAELVALSGGDVVEIAVGAGGSEPRREPPR